MLVHVDVGTTMRIVETAVLDVAVEEGGSKEGLPVLLLHGWPDAPRGWRPVAGRLHERGWRTIVPALRGTGETRFRALAAPETDAELLSPATRWT